MHPLLLSLQACGSNAGLSGMASAVQQMTQVILVGIGLYFLVGLVINLAQAQLSTATGDSSAYAHALQQAAVLVILLTLAGALPGLSQSLSAWLTCSDGTAAGTTQLWKSLAGLVVSIILGGAGTLLTVSLVWSGLGMQFHQTLGVPGGVASGIRRMVVLLVGGVLTLSAVVLANTILARVW